jgi:hypothetical protein
MSNAERRPTRLRSWLGLLGFLAIAGLYLWTEHRAHLTQAAAYLPYLLVLACPLLHIFMHGGHRHGSHGAGGQGGQSPEGKEGNP